MAIWVVKLSREGHKLRYIVDKNENPTSFVFCEQTVSIRNFFWHISKFRYSEKAASSMFFWQKNCIILYMYLS